MTVKSEVQGVVQALFGAYAGGYLAELTAEATANGTGAVAARLASVQGIILGKNLSSDDAFINTILGNMGIGSLNAAYAPAFKWATEALAGGASRADVVTSAIAFLDGIAAGTIVDAAYSAIAKAYATKVAAGVTYSETAAGSKVLSVTALQTASGATTPADVSKVVAEQSTAQAAVTSFLAALDLDKDGAADGLSTSYIGEVLQNAAVDALPAAAETAVSLLVNGSSNPLVQANPILQSAIQYDYADTGTVAAVAANNALEDSAAVAIKAQLANSRTLKASDVTAKTAALGTTETRAANKAIIDAQIAAVKAATAAAAAAETADIKAEAAVDTWAANATTLLLPVVTTDQTVGANNFGSVKFNPLAGTTAANVTVTYTVNSTAVTAKYTASGWTYSAGGVADGVTLSAEAKAAAEAVYTTALAQISADQIVVTRTTAVANNTALSTPVGTGTDTVASLYADSLATLTAHDEAVAILDKALSAVDAARKLSADLTLLETAVETATAQLTAAGYNAAPTLENTNAVLATSKSDLYSVNGLKTALATATAASITAFGAAGDDALIVTGFKQATTAKGDNNVLEFFVKQVGADTVITFENKAYGLSDTNAAEATVTLVGVDSTTLTFADGLIIG